MLMYEIIMELKLLQRRAPSCELSNKTILLAQKVAQRKISGCSFR